METARHTTTDAIERPQCIMIAGPNGAGETTSSRALAGQTHGVWRIVDADEIAGGISGEPQLGALAAGKLALAANTVHRPTARFCDGDHAFGPTLAEVIGCPRQSQLPGHAVLPLDIGPVTLHRAREDASDEPWSRGVRGGYPEALQRGTGEFTVCRSTSRSRVAHRRCRRAVRGHAAIYRPWGPWCVPDRRRHACVGRSPTRNA